MRPHLDPVQTFVPLGIAVTLCEACPPDGRPGRFLAIEGDHSVTCKRETSDFFSKWVFHPPLSTAGAALAWGATVTLTSSLGSVLASDGATGVVGALQTSHALRLVRQVPFPQNQFLAGFSPSRCFAKHRYGS